MIFNSFDFAVYLPIVFFLYWYVTNGNLKAQNLLIVLASYVFYGWWDYRFLSLIAFSSVVDYTIGNTLHRTEKKSTRKMLLIASLLVNLGLLGFFKYYNFFVANFESAFSFFGYKFEGYTLKIILPVGISFYTFQTLSYTIDVYRKKLEPTKDFIAFLAFVSFFPQLVAGPIERATNLLPQFFKKRNFDYTGAVIGTRQILWGLFKKVVIADQCAIYVNSIFDNSAYHGGIVLLLGAILFAFQIYGDFSGYSDIAIGVARLFGFKLMQNFAFPYFSRDIAEFWRRWHISLSTWFRDYLYIPLGGSRVSQSKKIRNTFIIFLVSGFWHGANWTFIIWGALNALYFLPLLLSQNNRKNLDTVAENSIFPSFRELGQMLLTFGITVVAWIFFRAENLEHSFSYLKNMLFGTNVLDIEIPYTLYIFLAFFLLIEWIGRKDQFAIEHLDIKIGRPIRWAFYIILCFCIIGFVDNQQDFIYFQF
ncbi:MBOAT family O-acyltransferase [Flagellimonas myxillae]|uniref:MBOAT family O-acyltransferase n=1 Tax=Flagellimonas myxillae TaxID=2942214 RepID=UPI00201F3FCB|nr:MBOAT family O-acyltransferase [Muricauda myxillae]MCL6266239.1 MBOAT family protein [Muricauda myxillae]